MPRVQLPDGRIVGFPDGMSEQDMARALATLPPADTSDQGPPSPSVMDERGFADKAIDWLPSVAGTIGGWVSPSGKAKRAATGKGDLVGAAASGGMAAIGELGRQAMRLAQGRGDEVPDTPGDALLRVGRVGLANAAQEAGGRKLVAGLTKIAPKLMGAALGTGDDAVVQRGLQEGVRVGPRDVARVGGMVENTPPSQIAERQQLRALLESLEQATQKSGPPAWQGAAAGLLGGLATGSGLATLGTTAAGAVAPKLASPAALSRYALAADRMPGSLAARGLGRTADAGTRQLVQQLLTMLGAP